MTRIIWLVGGAEARLRLRASRSSRSRREVSGWPGELRLAQGCEPAGRLEVGEKCLVG